MIVTTDHRIPSALDGYEVLLRNKRGQTRTYEPATAAGGIEGGDAAESAALPAMSPADAIAADAAIVALLLEVGSVERPSLSLVEACVSAAARSQTSAPLWSPSRQRGADPRDHRADQGGERSRDGEEA